MIGWVAARMRKKVFIIGSSHTTALRRALTPHEAESTFVVATPKLTLDWDRFSRSRPDVVCLAISGNQHNILGIFDDPNPFTIVPGIDRAANGRERHFIPTATMRELLRMRLAKTFAFTHELHGFFDSAEFLHICAPPPHGDLSTVTRFDKGYNGLRKFGFVPNPIRARLWQLQCDCYLEVASELGATFIEPPADTLTPEGMLRKEFCRDDDPTHASVGYGRMVLDDIFKRCEATA